MMGAFQGAFTKIMGGIAAGKLLEEKRQKAMQNVEDVKMAKLRQRDEREKLRANIEKNKLARIEAKRKTAEEKDKIKAAKQPQVKIGGKVISDPALIQQVMKEAK